MWCGSHAPVTARHDSDAVCYCDECVVGVADSLYPRTACNVQYHIACHPFKWGRGQNGNAAPWYMECIEDWLEEGPFSLHSGCLVSRGGIDISYDPDLRELARDLQPLPPLRKRRGRSDTDIKAKRSSTLQTSATLWYRGLHQRLHIVYHRAATGTPYCLHGFSPCFETQSKATRNTIFILLRKNRAGFGRASQ